MTVRIALRAGQIDGQMQAAGMRAAPADLLIGVTALELGYAVATANTRHFQSIPNLTVQHFLKEHKGARLAPARATRAMS